MKNRAHCAVLSAYHVLRVGVLLSQLECAQTMAQLFSESVRFGF